MLVALGVWLLAMAMSCLIIFFAAVTLITFSDCETGYVNPIDLARKLNPFVKPEIYIFGGFMVLLMICGFFVEFILNIPFAAYYIRNELQHKSKINPVTVFTDMHTHKVIAACKIGYSTILFFTYLGRMIYYLVQQEGLN
ncbi:protein cornichon [Pelomyxa schiedti]|nr:protein cornichon [Pelomyxa schiedti]